MIRRDRPTPRRQAARFAVIGILGTAGYLVLYLLLRAVVPAQPANVLARVAIAVLTTRANASFTFGTRVSPARLYLTALAVLGVTTAVTGLVLAVEQAEVGSDDRPAELAALALATAVATVTRFVLLRAWLVDRPALSAGTKTRHSAGPAASGRKDLPRDGHETASATAPVASR